MNSTKPITMDDVCFELNGLTAIMELLSVAVDEDCAALNGREDHLAHITLANRTNSIYSHALDYLHCKIHGLRGRVENALT